MLQGLEADGGVEVAQVAQRRVGVAEAVVDPVMGVVLVGVNDRLAVAVDGDDFVPGLSQDTGAVADAASDVDDPAPGREL